MAEITAALHRLAEAVGRLEQAALVRQAVVPVPEPASSLRVIGAEELSRRLEGAIARIRAVLDDTAGLEG